MLRQFGCFVASVAILQVCLASTGRAALAASAVSGSHVEPYRIASPDVSDAFHQIAGKSHVPIGVEGIFNYHTEPTIKIEFPGGTLADLLNRLVSQAPNYQWKEEDGIIRVLWHGTHLPIANVVIAYPGAHDKTVEAIYWDLGTLPELRAWLRSDHCSLLHGVIGAQLGTWDDRRISIDAGSMRLRELLDRVAIKSGGNYWAIVRSSAADQQCWVSILF